MDTPESGEGRRHVRWQVLYGYAVALGVASALSAPAGLKTWGLVTGYIGVGGMFLAISIWLFVVGLRYGDDADMPVWFSSEKALAAKHWWWAWGVFALVALAGAFTPHTDWMAGWEGTSNPDQINGPIMYVILLVISPVLLLILFCVFGLGFAVPAAALAEALRPQQGEKWTGGRRLLGRASTPLLMFGLFGYVDAVIALVLYGNSAATGGMRGGWAGHFVLTAPFRPGIHIQPAGLVWSARAAAVVFLLGAVALVVAGDSKDNVGFQTKRAKARAQQEFRDGWVGELLPLLDEGPWDLASSEVIEATSPGGNSMTFFYDPAAGKVTIALLDPARHPLKQTSITYPGRSMAWAAGSVNRHLFLKSSPQLDSP